MIVLHLQDINESVKRRTRIDRELNDYRLVPESLLHAVLNHIPVSLFAVQLVHGNYYRHIVLLRETGIYLCSYFDSLLGIDNENTVLANFECRDCAAYEIISARGIDYIEFGIHKLCIQRCRENGSLIHLLNFSVV